MLYFAKGTSARLQHLVVRSDKVLCPKWWVVGDEVVRANRHYRTNILVGTTQKKNVDTTSVSTLYIYLHSSSNWLSVSSKLFATILNGSSVVRSTPATFSSDTGSRLPPSVKNLR